MIGRYIVSVIFFAFFYSCSQSNCKNDEIIHAVVSDYERHSYFINLKLQEGEKVNQYVIANLDLYRYFKAKYRFERKQYEDYILPIIKNDEKLEIDLEDLSIYPFHKVIDTLSINIDIRNGKEAILRKYFHKVLTNYVINDGISENEKYCIVNALFKWG